MIRRANNFLLMAVLILCFGASSCGISNPSITFKTKIQNAGGLTDYGLDFEGGTSKLLLVPIESIPELKLSVFELGDNRFIQVANEDEYASIPLTETIDIKLRGIKPGSYAMVVNSIRVRKDEFGIMVLMVKSDGNLFAYGFEVDQEGNQSIFGPAESFLGFWR